MISMIWAMDCNNLIGIDNKLPWHYSEDFKYFKETTMNKTVLMGDNTFYSIGRPLPNRNNVVATLDENFKADGVTVTHDLFGFLNEYKEKDEELFVIGGKQIYILSMPYADRLYITHINKAYEGNVYFPKIDYSLYNVIFKKDVGELSFVVYERKK